MKYSLLSILLLFLFFGCQNNDYESNYNDYLADQNIMKTIKRTNSCKKKLLLFKKIKTLDYKSKFQYHYKNHCDSNIVAFKMKKDDKSLSVLSDMMQRDQEARTKFETFLYKNGIIWQSINLENPSSDEEIKYQHYFDTIVGEVDRKNQRIFDSLIKSKGEWIGAKYIPQKPNFPKLSVMIGHWPEESFEKYTKMAYKSAKQNNEYWSNVENMVAFSFKYPIKLDEESKNLPSTLYPFRFTEFNGKTLKASGITQIEFNYIAGKLKPNDIVKKLKAKGVSKEIIQDLNINTDNESVSILLLSSLSNRIDRKKLIDQTESMLLNLGVPSNLITKSYNKIPDNKFKLYYKIIK